MDDKYHEKKSVKNKHTKEKIIKKWYQQIKNKSSWGFCTFTVWTSQKEEEKSYK